MGGRYIKFVLKFLLISSEAVYLNSVCAAQLNHENLNNDLDNLRVSSHQLQDPAVNYHTIELDSQDDRRQRSRTIEQLTNHIGKPLVALPSNSANFQAKPNVPNASQSKRTKLYDATGQPRAADQNGRLIEQRKVVPSGVCQWMSLQEFKNVSLATSELIIRDKIGYPIYVLSIRGSLRRDSDSYFPLNKFQVQQEASILMGGGGVNANLPGNCSANLKGRSGGVAMVPTLQRPGRSFEEKITLAVECGYLVLHLQSNGIYLILKSISFYRNLDAVSQPPNSFKKNRSQSRAPPAMQEEHLVFSNEGTEIYPLLVLPITSRYICPDRIVLTGKNSVQLELNWFELQRITYPMLREFKSHSDEDNADDDQAKWSTLSGMRMKRETGELVPRDSSSLERCPVRPGWELKPLIFMMTPLIVKRKYESLNEALSDRLTQFPPKSSSSNWINSTIINLSVGPTTTIVIYLLIHFLVLNLVCAFENMFKFQAIFV